MHRSALWDKSRDRLLNVSSSCLRRRYLVMGLVMLTTLLLAGMVAAPLSFTGLVIPVKRHACAAAGRWPAIRRFVLAVAATTAVAVAVAASLGLSGISGHDRDAG